MPSPPSSPPGPRSAPPAAVPPPIAPDPGDEPPGEAKDWAIRALLDEPIPLNFPNDTPLGLVFEAIQAATRGRDARLPEGIPIHVDPRGLQDAERNLRSTVSIDLDGVPLRTSLHLLLRQVDLAYVVRDGILTVTSRGAATPSRSGVVPNAADRPANRAIRVQLERRVPMHFAPRGTLEDLVRLVREATRDAAAGLPDGIPVYVHPEGLREVDMTLGSPIRIGKQGEPLRATLAEALATIRLTYVVEGGLLHVVAQDKAR